MIQRGDVWWVDLGEPRGAEPGYCRPVVVVQADALNDSRLNTVMVVPLTSNLRRAKAAGNVVLGSPETGLSKQSVALTCQVTAVDKDWLTEHVRPLPGRAVRKLDAGLKLTLGLD